MPTTSTRLFQKNQLIVAAGITFLGFAAHAVANPLTANGLSAPALDTIDGLEELDPAEAVAVLADITAELNKELDADTDRS